MKKTILAAFMLPISLISFSQNQEVLGSAGETFVGTAARIDYTVGESIISTGVSGSSQITQGFHQTNLTITLIEENDAIGVNVFPNPVVDFLTISNKNEDQNLTVLLTDVNGKRLYSWKLNSSTTEIDVSNYETGIYFVNISNAKNNIKSFKILKTH